MQFVFRKGYQSIYIFYNTKGNNLSRYDTVLLYVSSDRGDPAPIDYLYQTLLRPRKQKYSLGKHARFALALTNVNSKQIDPN